MNPERILFAFFPYLVTRERVNIRGITFRSSQDIADLLPDVQGHITTLSEMFFLEHGVRIERMICAYLELPEDKEEKDDLIRRLHEAHLLIGYLYSQPHSAGRVLLPFENSTLFVFRIGDTFQNMLPTSVVWQGHQYGDRVKEVDNRDIPATELTPGYTGKRNHRTWLWVAKGSRIFPEIPHIILNHTQDLFDNLQMTLSHHWNWGLEYLYSNPHEYPFGLRRRVFVSINWYMRSCRDSLDDAEAIVHLAIALESLLHLRSDKGAKDRSDKGEVTDHSDKEVKGRSDKGQVTDRFKNAVLTLLGPVPRLEDWLIQFYDARSKAVHEGVPSDLVYLPDPKKKDEGHRPHLEYGRRIFRLCLASILSGARHVLTSRLDALFIPNAERLAEICRLLNQKVPANKRLLSIDHIVDDLSDYGFDLVDPDMVSLDSVVGAVKLALRTYKEAVPAVTEPVKNLIDNIVSTSGDPTVALFKQIEECAIQLQPSMTDRSTANLTQIISALLMYASKPTFQVIAMRMEDIRAEHTKRKSG
jgi:hypothetical protein